MAIKVHGTMFSTATMRVLACLHEKGLDYELVTVNMMGASNVGFAGLTFSSLSFMQPFGQVPGFEDGDLQLFESRAINHYIAYTYADKGTPLFFKDPKKMAIIAVAMEVEAHHYDRPASKLTWELCIKPLMGTAADEAIVKEQEAELAKVLDVYESRLAKSKYLCGDTFTLADLHHLPTLNYLMGTRVKTAFNTRPRVSAWCADIMARPSWKKVIAMRNTN